MLNVHLLFLLDDFDIFGSEQIAQFFNHVLFWFRFLCFSGFLVNFYRCDLSRFRQCSAARAGEEIVRFYFKLFLRNRKEFVF